MWTKTYLDFILLQLLQFFILNEYAARWWCWWIARPSESQMQPTHQRRQDQGNGERLHSVPRSHSEWTTGDLVTFSCLGYLITEDGECTKEFPTRLNRGSIGDRGIAAENMEKSQHTDFNEDKTNESASNVRLWKLDTQKEWRNTSWRLWDVKTEKDSLDFMDSKENKLAAVKRELLDTIKRIEDG